MWKSVARRFLLIGSDRASKTHENGRAESFEHVQKPGNGQKPTGTKAH